MQAAEVLVCEKRIVGLGGCEVDAFERWRGRGGDVSGEALRKGCKRDGLERVVQ